MLKYLGSEFRGREVLQKKEQAQGVKIRRWWKWNLWTKRKEGGQRKASRREMKLDGDGKGEGAAQRQRRTRWQEGKRLPQIHDSLLQLSLRVPVVFPVGSSLVFRTRTLSDWTLVLQPIPPNSRVPLKSHHHPELLTEEAILPWEISWMLIIFKRILKLGQPLLIFLKERNVLHTNSCLRYPTVEK